MAVFNVGKDFDEVQEAKLMPEDWYTMEISQEPEQAPNAKMKDGGAEAEGAGFNIVVRMKSLCEDAEFSGRLFTIWLPLPNDSDEGEFISGQSKADWKLERIAKVAAAFAGLENYKDLTGDEISLPVGARAQFYVTQAVDRRDNQTLRNEVDLFNNAPKPVNG